MLIRLVTIAITISFYHSFVALFVSEIIIKKMVFNAPVWSFVKHGGTALTTLMMVNK